MSLRRAEWLTLWENVQVLKRFLRDPPAGAAEYRDGLAACEEAILDMQAAIESVVGQIADPEERA